MGGKLVWASFDPRSRQGLWAAHSDAGTPAHGRVGGWAGHYPSTGGASAGTTPLASSSGCPCVPLGLGGAHSSSLCGFLVLGGGDSRGCSGLRSAARVGVLVLGGVTGWWQ